MGVYFFCYSAALHHTTGHSVAKHETTIESRLTVAETYATAVEVAQQGSWAFITKEAKSCLEITKAKKHLYWFIAMLFASAPIAAGFSSFFVLIAVAASAAILLPFGDINTPMPAAMGIFPPFANARIW